MKIAFLECAQNFGGARKAAITMAHNLCEQHEASIIDFYGSCKPFIDSCRNNNLRINILSPSDPYCIQSAQSLYEKIKNLILFIPHMVMINKRLRLICKEQNIDYLCVSSFRPMLAIYIMRPKAKVVFFAHAWYIKKVIPKHEMYLLKRVPDKIVCISEATRQAIYNNGISKFEDMTVVQNSICESDIPLEIASIKKKYDDFVILHNGGFTPGKGQLISVQIAKELKRRGFCFKMVFTGIIYKGNESRIYYEEVQNKVKEYGLEQNVIFIINRNGVYDYIRACDILIHPSETEGFPLCVLEAQILKKPVIANAVGGVIDMVLDGYTGFLPDYNNINQYCDIIINLKTNNELYNYISQNAYNLARTCFTKEKQIVKLNKVFSK